MYLEQRFGELAFIEKDFYRIPAQKQWSKCSPQHASSDLVERLFPGDWIASSFSVVRHPVSRIVSSYNYHLAALKKIPLGLKIEDWFEEYISMSGKRPYWLDNHLRPQCELVPIGAKVFRLEDGLDSLVSYFDILAGNPSGPREILREHATPIHKGMELKAISEGFYDQLCSYYAEDFQRFGYDCAPESRPRVLVSSKLGASDHLRLIKYRLKHHLIRSIPRGAVL